MVYIFSSQTQRILSHAGWFPARHISIQSYIDSLEAEGYVVFPVVSAFLHEFGGLYLAPTWLDHPLRRHEIAEFDAGRATEGIFIERVQWYEAYLGRQLCVIGTLAQGHAILLMDAAGAVYSTYDNLVYWGNSGEEAIEQMCGEGNNGKILLNE